MPGTLFVVATPIGNLEDLTFRALRTLGEVDLIAAEDTRRTAKLLSHYKIHKPTVSVREHNEARAAARIIEILHSGKSVALVSDAGTPGIADPGARLVRDVRAQGIRVVPIPGASAVTAALSVAGFSGDQFVFMGFPPPAGTARRDWFESLATETRLVVFFESPHRIERTLADLAALDLVERPIIVARELTKHYESLVECLNTADLSVHPEGEFAVVVAAQPAAAEPEVDASSVFGLYSRLVSGVVFEDDEAMAVVARMTDLDESKVAKIVKKAKILVKQQSRSAP